MSNPRDTQPVRVRFAPSPTGLLHLGGARTALYNYLLAKQTGGQFILRIEDTDQKRYNEEAEQNLIDGMKWLGIEWDEGPDIGGPHAPYHQTQRKQMYLDVAQELMDNDKAFKCFCTAEELNKVRETQQKANQATRYSGKCRDLSADDVQARVDAGDSYVIRFKMPKTGSITGTDRVRGSVTFENAILDDKIIVKSDGMALYHLAAMVDDHLMEITHVFRGEEWLPSLPLHVHIYEALGWEQPEWVHLSLFLKPSGKGKMSKRESAEMRDAGHAIFVDDMEELGYLPEGVNNWISLMGWSYDGSTEFFTMDDLIEKFSIDKLSPKNAAIDYKKFDHYNKLHIQALSVEEMARRIAPHYQAAGIDASMDALIQIAPLLQTRLTTLDEAPDWTRFLFVDEVTPSVEDLIAKGLDAEQSAKAAQAALDLLRELGTFDMETVNQPMRDLAEKLGIKLGQLLTPVRVAIAGGKVSPPLFESMDILGAEKTFARIEAGIKLLKQ